MARATYYVVVSGSHWGVNYGGRTISTHVTQANAIETARQHAHAAWARGTPSQVLVQGADAKWRIEWTYGHDPVRTPG